METSTAPTTSHYNAHYFLNRHNLYECRHCGSSYFLLSQLDEHLPTHYTEGITAEGQETFGLPTPPATPEPVAPAQDLDDPADELRWTSDGDGGWLVRGPARLMREGATLVVTSRKGTKSVTLGPVTAVARKRWDSEDMAIAPEAKAAKPAEVRPDFLAADTLHILDGDTYKVVIGKFGPYVKRLVGRRSWSYCAGTVKELTADTVLSAEKAAELGHLHGICACCGAELERLDSIERGIGPDCFRKYFR